MKLARWISPALIILGAIDILTGIEMFFFPSSWFYKLVPGVPETGPFNAHLVADGGTFFLAIGVGLLIASRDPTRHWAAIVVAAIAGMMHAALHIWSHEEGILSLDHLTTEVLGIYIPALILIAILFILRRASAARNQG
jgi:uncharacterized membrane protein